MTTIQQDLQAFFAKYPEVSIEQFAQMADVYAITVQRGLEGEKLWESSIERIKSVIDVYCTKPKLVKCDNCDEMVEMISTGEFCPCCFC
jgi:hypothetical protein